MNSFKYFLMIAGLCFGANTFAAKANLPATNLRFEVSNAAPIDHVDVYISCYRASTAWEYLNNGGDAFSRCDKLLVSPDSVDRAPLRRNTDGSFALPAVQFEYTGRAFKAPTLCVRISPQFRPGNLTEGDLYENPEEEGAAISFCTQPRVPEFFPNYYLFNNLHSFEEADRALSQPITVRLKKYP